MTRSFYQALITCIVVATSTTGIFTSVVATAQETSATTAKQTPAFVPFTGKVVKSKVRLRTQPTLEDNVFRELQREEMLVIVGEMDGFYITQAPKDLKAYVFRMLVLDGVVEGSHVNVRLKPDLDAPVIAQLNAGDRVECTVCAANNKWVEIKMPETTRFYVAKEYVQKVGDAGMLAKVEKRHTEVDALLDNAYSLAQVELAKPFDQIDMQVANATLQKIIVQYPDFPIQTTRAKELLTQLQETFLQKKIAFLESSSKEKIASLETDTQRSVEEWKEQNQQLVKELEAQQQRLAQLEKELDNEKSLNTAKEEEGREKERQAALLIEKTTLEAARQAQKAALEAAEQSQAIALEAARVAREAALKEAYEAQAAAVTNKMIVWKSVENLFYENWKSETKSDLPITAFYEKEMEDAVTLRGILEPYNHPIKNRPGDYMLLNQADNKPIAYLYSTQINLQENIGQIVTIKAASRPNNYFAFPAYYALAVE